MRFLPRRRSAWHSVRWPFLAYLPAVVALARWRRRLRVPRPITIPVVSASPLAVAVALPRSKWRYAAVWATYVWLFKVAWEVPYDEPEKLRQRLGVRYAVRLDSLVGGGVPPTLRLQRALRDPPRVVPLDVALTAVHYSLWLAPHVALMWVLARDERRFPRLAGRLAAVYHLTTVGYWLLPAAPPWYASEEHGEMDGEVARVPKEVSLVVKEKLEGTCAGRLLGDGSGDQPLREGNPWAAMPSDHFAAASITAIGLAEVSPAAGAVGWASAALAGFALVYLGEHYVTDLVAGLALAVGVWRVEPVVEPLFRLGAGGLRLLEPSAR